MQSKNYKTKRAELRAQYMNSTAFKVMNEMVEWLEDRGYVALITDTVSTKEEDKVLKRVSASHREGRAFDVRTSGLPTVVINELITHFTKQYSGIGAISAETGKRALIVDRTHGTGPHLHVQLSRLYAAKIPVDLDKIA